MKLERCTDEQQKKKEKKKRKFRFIRGFMLVLELKVFIVEPVYNI